jgi:glycosyltransferase involved in cell wall biosynthesis
MVDHHKIISIAAFLNAPAKYRIPIFKILAENNQIKTDLYYLCKHWSPGWNELSHIYPYTIASSIHLLGFELYLPPLPLVKGILSRQYESVIINGWGGILFIFFHVLCYIRRIPVVVLSDTRIQKSRSPIKVYIRKQIVKRLLNKTSAAIVTGKLAAQHLYDTNYQDSVFIGNYAVDINTFFPVYSNERDNSLKLLFVGRLIKRKRAADVVKAVSELIEKEVPVKLKIAGDGPCFGELHEIVTTSGMGKDIELLGPVPHEKLSGLMQSMDVLIVPSQNEPWGVVVAEGAACGLELLLSSEVGAAQEFLISGENGYLFTVCDIDSMKDKILKLLDDKKQGRMFEMKKVSRHTAEKFSMDNCADVYYKAIITSINSNSWNIFL